MSYFPKFPTVPYTFDTTGKNTKSVVDVTVGLRLFDYMPERSSNAYVDYIVQDGETPQHIADRVYGSPNYDWIVLLANRVENPYYDWPLSSKNLEANMEIQYPGVALFFSPMTDVRFTLKDRSTKLTVDASHFSPGEVVTQVQGSASVTGNVHSWDATFRKLVVTNVSENKAFVSGSVVTSTNNDGVEFEATPKRVVNRNVDAVHHFVDDFGNWLDPYGKLNYYEYDDNKVYTNKSIYYENDDGIPVETGTTASNDFMLNKYINGNSSRNIVTNYQFESNKNDLKRRVKILRTEYSSSIISQYNKIFEA